MKKLLFLLSFYFLLFTLKAQDDVNAPLPKDQKVLTGTLPNGIRYYVRKNTKPEKRAELRLVVNAGSTSEDDDQQGFAHFVEHMAFNGSKNFKKNELVDYLESVGTKFGPHLNAYTSFNETVYMIQLPTDTPSIINKGIQILGDWAENLSFDSVEVEKERGVVIEEWRLGQGADERMRRKYWPLLFKGSRYADRLPIGKKEIIEKGSRAAAKRFYTDWYRPDLMAVVAVGDFEPSAMVEKIKKQFSTIPARSNKRPLSVYSIPENNEMIIATATDKEAQYTEVEIIFKQPVTSEKTIGDYRLGLARQLFVSMMRARSAELERLGDPPFLGSSCYYGRFIRNQYIYSCQATCKENGIGIALKVLVGENERVRRYGFTATELERQKNEMMRGMELAYAEREKTESRNFAREYVSNFLSEEPFPGIEFEYELTKKYLPGISLEEINSFASQWITDGKNCIVLITAPENQSAGIPGEDQLKSIFGSMKTMELKPYEDKVTEKPLLPAEPSGSKITYENKIETFNITEWNLANGVKVFAKPTDFKNDQIIFNSFSWGGWSVYPDSDYMSAAYSDAIIDASGVGEFDLTSLEKKLSGKIVSCSPFISELMQGFNGGCSPRDLETLMQLIYLYSVSPRLDSVAFNSWLEKERGTLINRNMDPASALRDTVDYVSSGYNYYFRPQTPELLKEINLERAFRIYSERFSNASSSVFVFVGNFNVDSLKKYTEKYLGALPSVHSRNRFEDIGVNYTKGKIERTVYMGQEPKSTVLLKWHMPFEYNRNNRNEVNALGKLINIRLREVLREEKSGVYGVSFISNPSHYPDQRLEQAIYFSCSPDNVNMLINSALDVIKEVKEKGCDEKNLVKIKETAIRERETYLKENNFWLNVISSNAQNGENILDLSAFNNWINKLKGSDFIGFANKYMQQDNYGKFVLLPAK